MVPEIGQFALALTLVLAASQATVPLMGAHKGMARCMALARPLAHGQLLFTAIAFGCLAWCFVNNDFSVLNVANNSNTELPLHYRFAATWGSHEGSLLLWVLMLALWMAAVATYSRQQPPELLSRVLAVMGLINSGFLLFLLFTSNPFERLFPAATQGRDLNPLLQDPGMVIHPPMLYMGYVGFSVAFAFAIAALLGGRLDAAWARWSRPWTTAAWCFLTVGIMLGSWWAYYELGWGGWWFWDPVENASFMPWLVGTALLHSLAVTEKRGAFKRWTALLAICTFSLSLLGTFLVRSGVLTSVHAFATDPARGVFILVFLALVVGGALTLLALRAPQISGGGKFDPVSRETMLLANNLLLLVAAGSVLLGTLYPLFVDALSGGRMKISVGPPYFEAVFAPLMTPLVFLMGAGPLARWKGESLFTLWTLLKWAAAVSLATALLLPLAAGQASLFVSLGLLLAFWIIAATVVSVRERLRSGRDTLPQRIAAQPRAWWGMTVAHLGVAVFIAGVTLVRGYEIEQDVRMEVGKAVDVAGYTFRFAGTREMSGPNYDGSRGTVIVSRGSEALGTLHPEKRIYRAQQTAMTEAAIDSGLLGDLYVSLGEPLDEGAWSMRIYHKPFVNWIWSGCVLMALGGILAISDRRYRQRALAPGEARAMTVTAG